MQPETDYLARTVVDVVRHATQAGEAIMQVYATAFDVTQKADQSPLTQADLAAHGLLTAALSEAAPAFPILSEESQEIVFEERRAWTTYWLVDPLDGTREFVKRNDEFTVNIALVHDGEPVLGVVHAPALALTYFAYVGGGAWRCRGAGTRANRSQ